MRNRECSNPAPEGGGDICIDETDNLPKMLDTESESCNTGSCSGKLYCTLTNTVCDLITTFPLFHNLLFKCFSQWWLV